MHAAKMTMIVHDSVGPMVHIHAENRSKHVHDVVGTDCDLSLFVFVGCDQLHFRACTDKSSLTIPTRLSPNQSCHQIYNDDDDISDEGEVPIPYSEYSRYNPFGPQITTDESTVVWF